MSVAAAASAGCASPHTPDRPAPTRELVGLNATPSAVNGTAAFKFYCPVCMVYFKEIKKTRCCINYLCDFCHADLPSGSNVCPFCMEPDYTLDDVDLAEEVRLYQDSPETCRAALTTMRGAAASHSPVTQGAGFEELQRKLLPLPVLGDITNVGAAHLPAMSGSAKKKRAAAAVALSETSSVSTLAALSPPRRPALPPINASPAVSRASTTRRGTAAAVQQPVAAAGLPKLCPTKPPSHASRGPRRRTRMSVVAPSASFGCGCGAEGENARESSTCVIC